MSPCVRGQAPKLLTRHEEELCRQYLERRRENPRARFEWRRRDGLSLLEVIREALKLMTDNHCSYCDGHPINDTGADTVDHFQPKARFPELAYTWKNLYLACSACNHAKGEQWDESLLRPDGPGFLFDRYFECDFATGELRPAPTAPPEEQAQARRTIEVMDLNRADTCKSRLRTVLWLRHMPPEHDDDLAYRYLIPICRSVP